MTEKIVTVYTIQTVSKCFIALSTHLHLHHDSMPVLLMADLAPDPRTVFALFDTIALSFVQTNPLLVPK